MLFRSKFCNTPMSPDLFATVNRMAKQEGISRAQLIRNLVLERLENTQELHDPCTHNRRPLEITQDEDGIIHYRCADCGEEFEQSIPF